MSGPRAVILIDPRREIGPINTRVYGQLIEHLGRVVYGGLFDPGSPLADATGIRLDVLELARQLKPSVLRWPGGNFASGYHWRDGIGPAGDRPARHDLAWDAIETNTFGTEEFLALARRLGAEPYLNLNASTARFDEAQSWVEYCNSDTPLPEVQMRQAGPHPAPHGVHLWGAGNENYGWWQAGHTSAESYSAIAREWGKLLHWTSPGIEIVGVGSPDPDWNWTVLTTAGHSIDYLSLHFYWHGDQSSPYYGMLSEPLASERIIAGAAGMMQEAQRKLRARRPIRLSIDEWGVWTKTHDPFHAAEQDLDATMRNGLSARSGIDTRFEERYDLKDALTVASWLHVLWRHANAIGIAAMAQMVNAIAPILTTDEAATAQTIFHPVAIARAHAGPISLDVRVLTDDDVPAPSLTERCAPVIDVGATTDERRNTLHVSIVNRHRDEEATVELDQIEGPARLIRLHHDDVFAANDQQCSTRIAPAEAIIDLTARKPLILPPHSHTTLILGKPR